MDYFLIGDLQPVMVTDAGVASHPIIVQVEDPAHINAVFDSISYSKVCQIILYVPYCNDIFSLIQIYW
jgi:aminopeptidase N